MDACEIDLFGLKGRSIWSSVLEQVSQGTVIMRRDYVTTSFRIKKYFNAHNSTFVGHHYLIQIDAIKCA